MERRVAAYQKTRPDLIGKAQLNVLHFCMGLVKRLGGGEGGWVYTCLNSDTAKIIGQFLILDAASDQLCEHELGMFLSSSTLSRQETEKLAQMTYRLYLTSEEEQQIPPLLGRFASSKEAVSKAQYRDLPEISWEIRSRAQAHTDDYHDYNTFLQLHPACGLHKIMPSGDDDETFCRGCSMKIHDPEDYYPALRAAQYHLASMCDGSTSGPIHLYAKDIVDHIVASLRMVLSSPSPDSCHRKKAAADTMKWMAELLVLHACMFCIETEENMVTLHTNELERESVEADSVTLFTEFCKEYEDKSDMCKYRYTYTWVSYIDIKRLDNQEEEDYISIRMSCLDARDGDDCKCRWCETFEDRVADDFLLMSSDDDDDL